MQTPGTKEHGPLFAELHAHLNIFLAKVTKAEWGMGYDFDFSADF